MDRLDRAGIVGAMKLLLAGFMGFVWVACDFCADAQTINAGQAEAQKYEERIASVQRDVLGRYDDSLAELQLGFQKNADLEGALAVRAERQRVAADQALTANHIVNEPKSLRALQTQTLGKLQELIAQLVAEAVPKLLEHKKSLTMAGKLDEAVAVRSAIERLQNAHLPVSRVEPGTVVTADALLQAYSADRGRADKIYKGQKIVVRGVVGGFRQDPAESKTFLVYLSSGTGGWVQCGFSANDYRFREEQQFNTSVLVISPKGSDGSAVRLQKGQTAEIRGTCEGQDEAVRLGRCEIVR
jgi:hypothetical protein